MGDKITAKTIAEQSGIPTVPGYKDKLPERKSELEKIATKIGFPIMIKATAGGGGSGLRVANDINELISGISITQQEAKNAFGNETLYLEKYIENPRHIEVQIFGDGKGKASI